MDISDFVFDVVEKEACITAHNLKFGLPSKNWEI